MKTRYITKEGMIGDLPTAGDKIEIGDIVYSVKGVEEVHYASDSYNEITIRLVAHRRRE